MKKKKNLSLYRIFLMVSMSKMFTKLILFNQTPVYFFLPLSDVHFAGLLSLLRLQAA